MDRVSATIAGRATDTLEWMLTANASHAHALETQGTVDSPDVNRTTGQAAQPIHNIAVLENWCSARMRRRSMR